MSPASPTTPFRVAVCQQRPWSIADVMIDRRTFVPLALTATDIASMLISGITNVSPILATWDAQGLAGVAGAKDRPQGLPPVGQGGAKPYRLQSPFVELVVRTRAMATRRMYKGESERYSFSGRVHTLLDNPDARGAMVWILMHPGRLGTSPEITDGAKLPTLPGQHAIGRLLEHGLLQRYGGGRTEVVYGIDPDIRQRLSVALTGHPSIDWTAEMAGQAVNILSDLVNAATSERTPGGGTAPARDHQTLEQTP